MALVTMNQYRELLKDRPKKFKVSEVGYAVKGEPMYQCQHCFHFYVGEVARRNTCEILDPGSEDRHIFPKASCKFWTRDGESFPQLEPPRK